VKTLIIGFGNPSRQDDGVGLAVVNGLRHRLSLPPLDEGDDGYDDLTRDDPVRHLDTLFLQQLSPELAELLSDYDHVCFVDAHLGVYPETVHRVTLQPQAAPAIVSHHLKPGTLLAFAAQGYGHAPTAELISIRGFAFDFGPELSPPTADGVDQVIAELWSRFGTRS
jgi:hydrogenase maturation protease